MKKITDKEKTEAALKAYIESINEIDDYFEYANESKRDREFVHSVLNKLTNKLTGIYKK
jgi:hypothetical protein